jgi:hypothetical protein
MRDRQRVQPAPHWPECGLIRGCLITLSQWGQALASWATGQSNILPRLRRERMARAQLGHAQRDVPLWDLGHVVLPGGAPRGLCYFSVAAGVRREIRFSPQPSALATASG